MPSLDHEVRVAKFLFLDQLELAHRDGHGTCSSMALSRRPARGVDGNEIFWPTNLKDQGDRSSSAKIARQMAKSKGKGPAKGGARKVGKVAGVYTHPDQTLLMRPEVGTQAQFRKKKPPQTYRYDSSLSPALDWDGGNSARELGEWLLGVIERTAALQAPHALPSPAEFRTADGRVVLSVRSLQEAVDQLKRLGRPFLTWTGKAERLSFDVPTLPLFVHERLSTKAIVETLVGHKADKQTDFWEMLGDPRHSITDQVLKAYEYPDKWVNRLILGDSLVVMNSLLHYRGIRRRQLPDFRHHLFGHPGSAGRRARPA